MLASDVAKLYNSEAKEFNNISSGGNRYLPYNLIEQNYINNLVLEDHEKLN